MLQWFGSFVGGFQLAAEYHGDLAFRIEPDDHVRALVRGPDIVVLVHAHRVCERPGVQVVSDLTNELAVGHELQELRGACRVCGTRRIAAREYEDMSLGINRHP